MKKTLLAQLHGFLLGAVLVGASGLATHPSQSGASPSSQPVVHQAVEISSSFPGYIMGQRIEYLDERPRIGPPEAPAFFHFTLLISLFTIPAKPVAPGAFI